MGDKQGELFYEDAFDALLKSIGITGKSQKRIALTLYPGKKKETAVSHFSRAMSSEHGDIHLTLEHTMKILEETRPEDFLFFLCDKFGFERPILKTPESFKSEIRSKVHDISDKLTSVISELDQLDRLNHKRSSD
jgi:hypothetical protein